MEETKDSLENKPRLLDKLKAFSSFIINKYNQMWESHKAGIIVLSIFLLIFMLVLILYPLYYDTIYNCYTDDVLQYYPYVIGFFNKVKHGELHLFDTSLLAGGSFFSSVYYVPLDLFLGFAFILSYIMPTEVAYSISNILRIVCGSLLIYYVFERKGYRPKVSFIISLIFLVGGMTETFYIFPVYLGISFYVPLAMLLVDLSIHKDNRFLLLIPLYSVTIVLYDFYIAYMLFAFLCVYFIIESHLANKKFFLISKEFWTRFLYFILMIFIGVSLSAFFLLPSSLYIVNETGRASQTSNDYLWLYGKVDSEGVISISARHYFQMWANMFTANVPHNLGLVKAGDYIREHASLYLTTGGAMYLAYFFLVGGKEANRLKPWVLLFNLLFCIPLFAMIFTFNEWPYVRWFFIPYMINFYAMAMAMNKFDFRIGTNKYIKLLPFIFMSMGLATMLYVLIANPELYFHYEPSSRMYSPIVIGSIVFISIFLALLLIGFILECFKKDSRFIYRFIPFTIFAECIFAVVIAVSTIGSHDYLTENREMQKLKEELYNMGYTEHDGYRINMFTSKAKNTNNASIMLGNVNHARFFQSFYNTPINVYYEDIHREKISGWSTVSMHGYTPLSAPQFNTKYVIAGWIDNKLDLPEELYTHIGSSTYLDINHKAKRGDNNYHVKKSAEYYELKDLPQFIVYEDVFNNPLDQKKDIIYNDLALLKYGYAKEPNTYETDDKKLLKLWDKQEANYNTIKESGINIKDSEAVFSEVRQTKGLKSIRVDKPDKYLGDNYWVYDAKAPKFKSILDSDILFVIPRYVNVSKDAGFMMYMKEDNILPSKQYIHPFHYNTFYPREMDYKPKEILLKADKSASNKSTYFYGLDYSVYTDFIERQNKYTNRSYYMDDSYIRISFDNPNANKPIIVKTAFAYSDDWHINNDIYKTVDINGGFLGVIVPPKQENVSFTLKFEPAGLNMGFKISGLSCIIYVSVSGAIIYLLVKKRKRKEV